MTRLLSLLAAVALLATATQALAKPAFVTALPGEIRYTEPGGRTRTITFGRNFVQPVLAPNGRTLAFIDRHEDQTTTLWVGDGMTGAVHPLAEPVDGDGPTGSFTMFGHPLFSLDGGFIYVSAEAWATSTAVHQVNVATGQRRFVIDGRAEAVLHTGPWRGYLLVGRHKYPADPDDGAYDTVDIVRPDGGEVILIPGSDQDSWTVEAWLKRKGWTAW